MKQTLFSGACTALVTPFLDGKVNYPMLEILLRRQIDAGIRAIVLCGTTGEAPTLTDSEKTEMIRVAKAYTGDSCMIIAGTGSNHTDHAVSLSVAVMEAGADALLTVSPYYNKATPAGLIAHFREISKAVHIPIILYNVPSRTGVDIPISVYQKLAKLPNIAGVKEATQSISKICKIRAECPPDFAVWSGNDDLTVPVISVGGKGVISVLSNVVPELTQLMTHAAINGDFETASALQLRLLPLIEALFSEVNPIPVKAAMKLLGYDCGNYRLPLSPISDSNLELLRTVLKNYV